MEQYEEVLKFWFEESKPEQWFTKDAEFDKLIIQRFSKLHEEISKGEHEDWENQAESMLAKIIVLDQFSRNMFRDSPKTYASDPLALELAKKALGKGFDKQVTKGREFFYLPFMHSENLEDQNTCVELYTQKAIEKGENVEEAVFYAVKHQEIIEKFGRFPHRNKILGRTSTKEEEEFLKQPNSSF